MIRVPRPAPCWLPRPPLHVVLLGCLGAVLSAYAAGVTAGRSPFPVILPQPPRVERGSAGHSYPV